jgi:hypothetical protein
MLMVSLSINIGYAICSQEQPMTSGYGKLLALLALPLLLPLVVWVLLLQLTLQALSLQLLNCD